MWRSLICNALKICTIVLLFYAYYDLGGRPIKNAEVQYRHIGQIAELMVEWEGLIADELKLTPSDVANIKTQYPQRLNLQT